MTIPDLSFDLEHPTLRLGLVLAEDVRCVPSDPALLEKLTAREERLREDASGFDEHARAAIRNVLRKGGYKPTGRGKPASEFLLGVATAEGVPRINNLVDINNLASLTHAHPISIFDASLLGDELAVRYGQKHEEYIFNVSGQSMDIAGLPVICRGASREAVGNAVKDSMRCKVHAETRRVLAVVYGTRELPAERLWAVCDQLAELLREHAGATSTETNLVP